MKKTKEKKQSYIWFAYIKTHWYLIAVSIVLVGSLLLRTNNFGNRWGLGSDDMRDIMISREALVRHELPVIGSFSSAGPFVFGPHFYWFVMLSYLILPFTIVAPWILFITQSVLNVSLLMYLGNRIGGRKLSLIIGSIAATSQQLVYRATSLSQHGLVAITSSMLLLFYVLFWQKKSLKYAFLMGISLGLAFGMHTQAINLFIFFPLLLIAPPNSWKKKFLSVACMLVGFVLILLPHLKWDYSQDWANIRNILDFVLIAQYRLYVPNSWRLYLFKYFADYWAALAGGYSFISIPLYFSVLLSLFISIVRRKISGVLISLGIVFFILILVNKSFRGERFDGYMIYFSPFIILFTGWFFSQLLSFSKNIIFKIIVFILLSIVIIGNINACLSLIHYADNHEKEYRRVARVISKKFAHQSVKLYDYKSQYTMLTFPLSFFLKLDGKTSSKGIPIGLACPEEKCLKGKKIIVRLSGYPIIDLRKVKGLDKKKSVWVSSNQEVLYDNHMQWAKTTKLESSFSLPAFIKHDIFHISDKR